MSKIWLITKREYLTRVKSKTFILTTLLAPLGIILLIAIVAFIFSRGSDEKRSIAISDPANVLEEQIEDTKNISFDFSDRDLDALKKEYENGEIDGILELFEISNPGDKNFSVNYYSDDQLALDESLIIAGKIEDRIREYKIRVLDLDMEKINSLTTTVTLEPQAVLETEKKRSSMTAIIGSIIGAIISYFMFFIIAIYGQQVMRSVMEEKINRVVEVLISSVKPFELMMGKILGVGSVGLTQVGIWIIILIVAFPLVGMFMDIDPTQISEISNNPGVDMAAAMESNQDMIAQVYAELGTVNWPKILVLSVFYFFAGYFAYAALFAAVGSAVGEDVNEAQSLVLPIMLPLILAFYISFSAVRAPDSSMAVWASMIPLLSSIVMPVRLPMDPPIWQIIVSVLLLIIFVVFFVWLAGRIYRVGILMYGKKASIKELSKWIFYKS